MNYSTKKTFNADLIENKAFLIQTGMTFNLRGETVTVLAAGENFTVLDHGNDQVSHPHPRELMAAYKNGLLIFKAKENAVLINKQFTREADKEKARILEPALLEIHQEANKFSKQTLDKVRSRVAKRLGVTISDMPSASTLRRKYNSWIENEMDIYPVIKEPKKTRAKRHEEQVIALAEQTIDEYFLVPGGLSGRQTYFKFVEMFEEAIKSDDSSIDKDTKIISQTTFENMLKSLNQLDVEYARRGKDAARAFAKQTYGQYLLDFPLQRVEIDALHLNIGLLDEDGKFLGTVIVYLAIDCYTRCIVGYSLSYGTSVAETSEAVIDLIKSCISPKTKSPLAENDWPLTGVPYAFYGDAGKAFNCREVKHLAAQIKCNYITTETKSPWKKAFIESLNRVIRQQFARLLPGYTRNNDEDNKEKSVEEIATLTLGEFINLLEYFILDYYHQNPHRGLYGNTPANECKEALKTCSPRIVPDLSKLDLLGGFEHEGVIQGGAGIQKNNLFYQSKQLNELRLELHKYRSKCNPKVSFLYSTKDVSQITVINELTGELIPVPCINPEVQPGMSLVEYKKKVNKPLGRANKQRSLTATNQVISDAVRRKAYKELEKAREKARKAVEAKAAKDSKNSEKVTDTQEHAKQHIETQKRSSRKNYTENPVAQPAVQQCSVSRPQTL